MLYCQSVGKFLTIKRECLVRPRRRKASAENQYGVLPAVVDQPRGDGTVRGSEARQGYGSASVTRPDIAPESNVRHCHGGKVRP